MLTVTPTPTTATAAAARAISTRARQSPLYSWKNGYFLTTRVCCVSHQHQQSQPDLDQVLPPRHQHSLRRRTLMGLSGAVMMGLSLSDEQSASGAARRPPPSPPTEKKDPNVSGVQAKVLASKKRKESMKEEMAKLRERGKPINKD